MTQFKHDKSCPVYGDFPADDVPCQCKGEQDNLTVEKINGIVKAVSIENFNGLSHTYTPHMQVAHSKDKVWLAASCADLASHIITLTKQVESLNLSLSGKTNFDEGAELKRQVKSLDEITAALHIVNAELGRRVESQKEEIRKYCEDGIFMTHEMIEDTAKQVARDCAQIAEDTVEDETQDGERHWITHRTYGIESADVIRTKYSLPKEE